MSIFAQLRSRPWPAFALGGLACLIAASLRGAPAQGSWVVILPGVLAIVLAMATQWVMTSLAAAVALGGLLLSVPQAPLHLANWGAGLGHASRFVWESLSDPFNLLLLAFVAPILLMISFIAGAGGFEGIVRILARYARGPRSTQIMTALAGLAIFFDEYAHIMIIGPAMRPMSDRYKVSREKLSFIVDSLGVPLTGLAAISTWLGYEMGLFSQVSDKLHFGRGGYEMFLDAMNSRFYCVFMIVFVLLNVLTGRDFGPMARAELRARRTGKLLADDAQLLSGGGMDGFETSPGASPRALTAVIPVCVTLVTLFAGFWIDGGRQGNILTFSAWQQAFISAQDGSWIFAIAATLGTAVAAICANRLGGLSARTLGRLAYNALKACGLPVAIMVLAWSLTATCNALKTGEFLASSLQGVMTPQLFPAVLFVVGSAASFATGTSWGTMAILIPTALPLAFHLDGGTYGLTTIICLGAVLDGSIMGDHCSPVTETAVMSALSCGSDLSHHVKTQMPYAFFVAAVALVCGYLPAGFGVSPAVSLAAGVAVMLLVFYTLGYSVDAVKGSETALVPPLRTEID